MATGQNREFSLDFGPLVEYLREHHEVRRMVETIGVKQTLEAVGAEQFWAGISPEQREELIRLAQKARSAEPDRSEGPQA